MPQQYLLRILHFVFLTSEESQIICLCPVYRLSLYFLRIKLGNEFPQTRFLESRNLHIVEYFPEKLPVFEVFQNLFV